MVKRILSGESAVTCPAVWSGRVRDFLAVVILLLLSTAFFANVLFTDQVLVGDNLAKRYPWRAYASEELLQRPTNRRIDPLHQYYPHKVIAARIVSTGSLPLWNPYFLSGTPFLATEPLAGLFYPPNVVYYLMEPLQGFGVSAWLHLFLAGTFMYLYLRSIELDRLSSLFGAMSFELSGYFLINLMWLSRVATATWAPLLFFCFEKYWREKKWRYASLLAFGVGMCILAGTPPVVVFVVFALSLYAAMRFFVALNERGFGQSAKDMLIVFIGVGLGVLLAAVQLLPTYEATPYIARAHWSYEEAWDTGRSSLALATAFVPDILADYWRPDIYAGILPLLLAFWALAFRRNMYVLFFAAVAILSLCLFLNLSSLLYRILYLIPVFRVGRLMEVKVTYAFALSVLTAYGCSSLVQETDQRARSRMGRASVVLLAAAALALVVVVITAVGWSASEQPGALPGWYLPNVRNFARVALVVLSCGVLFLVRVRDRVGANLYVSLAALLLVADLFSFGWKLNPPQRAQDLFYETGSTRFLRGDDDLFRIIRGPGSESVLPPNTPAVYGISDAQGYSSLMLDYYGEFMNIIEPDLTKIIRIRPLGHVRSFSSPLLDLLNVKYILTTPDVSEELIEYDQAHEDIELVYDSEIRIYENRDFLPRAFLVHDFEVLTDRERMLSRMSSDDFDPGGCVLLDEEPAINDTDALPSGRDSTARILDYAPNRVTVQVDSATDAFLVLTDLYYEGWKAFVDGQRQKVYRADYVFRAVPVGEGRHVVEFVFDPWSFQVGWRISALTAGAIGLSLVYVSCRDRRLWRSRQE